MTPGRAKERTIYWVGGVAAIVGSLAGMVGNLLHPETPLDDEAGIARTIADSHSWLALHMTIEFGILLMLGALVALAYSISDGAAGALSKLGLAAGIAGVAVGLVLVILDGVAAKVLADRWAAAPPPEQATALRIVLANETTNLALASLFNILFAGATFILFGLAVALSDMYPRWLGWIAVVAGAGSIGSGMVQAVAGKSTAASQILTIIGPTVITLWLFVIGIFLVRKAAALAAARAT
jgi:hypothetical protein